MENNLFLHCYYSHLLWEFQPSLWGGPMHFCMSHMPFIWTQDSCQTSSSPDDEIKLSPGPLGARSPLSILHFPGCVVVQIVKTWYHLYFFPFLNPDSLDLSDNGYFNQLHISLVPALLATALSRYPSTMQSFQPSLPYFISLFWNPFLYCTTHFCQMSNPFVAALPDWGPG